MALWCNTAPYSTWISCLDIHNIHNIQRNELYERVDEDYQSYPEVHHFHAEALSHRDCRRHCLTSPLLPENHRRTGRSRPAIARRQRRGRSDARRHRICPGDNLLFCGRCRRSGGAPGDSYRDGGTIQHCKFSKHCSSPVFLPAVPRQCAPGGARCALSE